jgi:hypothetical protein
MEIVEDYTNPENPGAFSSINTFLKNTDGVYTQYAKSNILPSLDAYSLHRPVRHKYTRSKYMAGSVDDFWQADLIDVKNLYNKRYGQAYNFILVCVDVLSKYAWAIPIKNKSAKETKKAFEKIFDEGRIPRYIQIDKGNEFKGECRQYLTSKNVKLYHTYTNTKFKAGIAERFNRTLKEKMYRMFTHNKNKNYISSLDDLLYNYNNTIHRAHGMRPANINMLNEDLTFEKLYGFSKILGDDRILDYKFKVGDFVRIFKEKTIMDKGYTKGWLKKIFIIHKRFINIPPMYELFNIKTSRIEDRRFYEQELQKILEYDFPYNAYEVLEENNNQILIRRIDNNTGGLDLAEPTWVDKEAFLQNNDG